MLSTWRLGLNIQFGYAGVLNFAAPVLGIGAYTSAVLQRPHGGAGTCSVLLAGGLIAALIGSLLLLPVLRTRGHYAALVTIAFCTAAQDLPRGQRRVGRSAGPAGQGQMKLFGWSFNESNLSIGKIDLSRST